MERKGVPSNPVDSDAETQPLESDLTSDGEFSSDSDEEEESPELQSEFVAASQLPTLIGSSPSSDIHTPVLTTAPLATSTSGLTGAMALTTPMPESEVARLLSMGNMPARITVCESLGRRSTLRSPLSPSTILRSVAITRLLGKSSESS